MSRLVRDFQLVDVCGRKYLAADERWRFLEAAARWIATAADHPAPANGISAVARFDDHAEAEEFARQLRIRLLAANS